MGWGGEIVSPPSESSLSANSLGLKPRWVCTKTKEPKRKGGERGGDRFLPPSPSSLPSSSSDTCLHCSAFGWTQEGGTELIYLQGADWRGGKQFCFRGGGGRDRVFPCMDRNFCVSYWGKEGGRRGAFAKEASGEVGGGVGRKRSQIRSPGAPSVCHRSLFTRNRGGGLVWGGGVQRKTSKAGISPPPTPPPIDLPPVHFVTPTTSPRAETGWHFWVIYLWGVSLCVYVCVCVWRGRGGTPCGGEREREMC